MAAKEKDGRCDVWNAFEDYIDRRTQEPNELDDPVKFEDVKKIDAKLLACNEKLVETDENTSAFVGLCQLRLDLIAQRSVAMKEIAEKVYNDCGLVILITARCYTSMQSFAGETYIRLLTMLNKDPNIVVRVFKALADNRSSTLDGMVPDESSARWYLWYNAQLFLGKKYV